MSRVRLLDSALLGSLALFAGWLVFETGSRGFLAFDQSIVFDGGYRVLVGQVPFRDFFLPTGPVPFWIQAAFFRLGSVSYPSYLLHAAFVNALAALLAFAWVRALFPDAKLYAYLAALLTAVWFYPPFGTPWLEQTAFLFHLVASVALLKGRRSYLWAATAGAAVVLAFFSKQNAGLVSFVACGLVVLSLDDRRKLLTGFTAGVAATAASFALWLFVRSHPERFWTFFVTIPAGEGMRRLSGGMLADLLLEEMSLSDPVRVASALAVVLGVSAWVSGCKRVAAASIVSLFLYQSLFIHVTNNEPENGFAFCGLLAAMGLALARSLVGASLFPRRLVAVLTIVVLTALGRYGWDISRSRYVHDVFFRSRFDEDVVSRSLAPVKWALPTPAARRSNQSITVEDVDGVVRYLRERPGNFFVFPDYTILYGVTGKTPPQPLLWFHPGLTYSRERAPWLDRFVVGELQRNDVRWVVLEAESWQGTERRLSDFPTLARFIESAFTPEREFGIFRVLKRRE